MENHYKSTAWSTEDLVALKICYDSRVPLKAIARFFGKTENSISKILTRSNIRPLGSQPRGQRPLETQGRCTTKEEVEALVTKMKLLQQSLKPHQVKLYYLTWQKGRVRPLSHGKHRRIKPLESWTSLAHLIKDLRKKGMIISHANDPILLRQGYEHLVNGAPMKTSELLRIVNTERVAQKLPRIFIEGITDNN